MKLVSAVFHPLLIPTYLFGVFIWFQPSILAPYSSKSYLYLWSLVAVTTFVIPVISISFLKLTKNIPDFKLEKREDRFLPFTFITFFYAVTTYMFITKINVGKELAMIMILTTVLIAALTVITTKYKISIHSAGIWGAVGILMALSIVLYKNGLTKPMAVAVALAGLVNSARLGLNVHSPRQVLLGSILGFTLCFLGVLLLI